MNSLERYAYQKEDGYNAYLANQEGEHREVLAIA